MSTLPVRERIVAALKSAPLFTDLSDNEIQALAVRAVRKLYSASETIFSQGEPCRGFYVISSGRIRIFKISPGGREQVLAIEGPGSSVAELPVFDGGPYPASGAAAEETEIVFISRKDFQDFCREHSEVALKVLAVVGARLRRLIGIIEELSFTTVRHRLVALLLRMAKDSGRQTTNGVQFSLPASHEELAHQIGTVRELVSRNLTRLQSEGLIEFEGRLITIKDHARLSTLHKSES